MPRYWTKTLDDVSVAWKRQFTSGHTNKISTRCGWFRTHLGQNTAVTWPFAAWLQLTYLLVYNAWDPAESFRF